jgi:hypothetical protein
MQTSDPSMDQTARISLHHPAMSKSKPQRQKPTARQSTQRNRQPISRKPQIQTYKPGPAPEQEPSSPPVKRYLGNQLIPRKRKKTTLAQFFYLASEKMGFFNALRGALRAAWCVLLRRSAS